MEIINVIFQYIPLDFILIVGGLIVVGEMLKKFTTLPNQFLTTALPLLGALTMGLIYGTGTEVFVTADFVKQISVGLLMGWTATGGYEFFKSLIKAKEGEIIKKAISYIDNEKIEIAVESPEEIKEVEIVEEENK